MDKDPQSRQNLRVVSVGPPAPRIATSTVCCAGQRSETRASKSVEGMVATKRSTRMYLPPDWLRQVLRSQRVTHKFQHICLLIPSINPELLIRRHTVYAEQPA